jgi:hypothetical protein
VLWCVEALFRCLTAAPRRFEASFRGMRQYFLPLDNLEAYSSLSFTPAGAL